MQESKVDSEDGGMSVRYTNMIGQFEIKNEMMLSLLKSIKKDKSPGESAGIYPTLLREARKEIARGLTKIFIFSLVMSEDLKTWRVANVVPLLKKGSRDNPGNGSDKRDIGEDFSEYNLLTYRRDWDN